ncbi:MAG: hypothetical protein DYH17_04205 [Xanthomonadales bacterium PRO6]|nr:hypothetical protein [Xanthomonadales bacterium PRO6]
MQWISQLPELPHALLNGRHGLGVCQSRNSGIGDRQAVTDARRHFRRHGHPSTRSAREEM